MEYGQKGTQLEELFRYLIIQSENGGSSLQNLEDNEIMFNYLKENKRSFEIYLVGFAKLKEKANDGSTGIKSDSNDDLYYYEFLKLDYSNKIIGNQIIQYDNISIKYDLVNFQFLEGKELVRNDFCEDLKKISRENKSIKSTSIIFEKAEKILKNDDKTFDNNFKGKIEEKNLKEYLTKLIVFSKFIKNKVNSFQKGFPNVIKFVETKEKDIFFFHFAIKREIDAAYKIINDNYDFEKFAGVEKKNLNNLEEKNETFKKGDILLFELKDSTIDNNVLSCLHANYDSFNGYTKVLKKTEEFKDSNFYYIGIQEKKLDNNNNDIHLIKDLVNKQESNPLKVKIYTFEDGKIFNKDYRKISPNKLKTLHLFREEIASFKNKFNAMEKKVDNINNKINILIFSIVIYLIFLLFKK